MSKKANKTAIGAFAVGALALLVAGIAVFGSGLLFKKSDKYVLFFDGSAKGLSTGAPVVFQGVKIGQVKEVNLLYNAKSETVHIAVVIEVELSRVNGTPEHVGYPDYNHLISHGLRARLEIQSFVTGQLMVALDFYPDTQPKLLGIVEQYPELPTLPAAPGIAGMLDAIPIKQISRNLQEATAGINKMLNAEWTCRLDDALKEITLSARAVRLFMEYLEQHPEALLKGKTVP